MYTFVFKIGLRLSNSEVALAVESYPVSLRLRNLYSNKKLVWNIVIYIISNKTKTKMEKKRKEKVYSQLWLDQ
jgi:hypothetical protein